MMTRLQLSILNFVVLFIDLVRHLQQQYCPRLNVREFLISPDLIQRYPLDNLPDSDLFDIHHVARSMLLHKKVVPSYKDGHGFFKVQSLPFEPYHQLSSSSVCQLSSPPVMTDQPETAPLLHEVPTPAWVVVTATSLAQRNQTEHCLPLAHSNSTHDILVQHALASVSLSSLLSVVPHLNTDMLDGFLQSLNFCRPVMSPQEGGTGTPTSRPHPGQSTADLLFFSGLIQSELTRQPRPAGSTRVWLVSEVCGS